VQRIATACCFRLFPLTHSKEVAMLASGLALARLLVSYALARRDFSFQPQRCYLLRINDTPQIVCESRT